ncbi:hypothetical protein SEA_KABOCHA_5 [Gordonia phage Kabocha]|uniref:Uncharacterized protein n=1 Tax=Gordonia phage Chidiebere TaxID=2656530 RepID=A0A649VKJ7_9CAUD|nr:hypothetical protein PQD14_gp005 [Gordonia phage Chidiebere]AZS07860.1 hypothetical protein PBI_GRAY_5 [Gordonia phage Gray]WAA19792.1 hypothetical protein SEA_KABOCHA_5 [Gordonia phage Kabocha]WAA19983.1 hypothetical protein SEA_HANEM_5 [Gordonia phage Hanem]WNM67026.1 hypothetical protein SEA_SCHOMBER_5 [Gordonia Phage Schomber]QGJ92897.1 hypothetical protein PBI_CHIDIEBERE_5 [Gordonia phage Chidiebere]
MAYQLPSFQQPYYTDTILQGMGQIHVQMSHCSVCHAAMQKVDQQAHTQWHQKMHNEQQAMLTSITVDFQSIVQDLRIAEQQILALNEQTRRMGGPVRKKRGTRATGHTAPKTMASDPRTDGRRLGSLADSEDIAANRYVVSPASGRKLTVEFDCPDCVARIDRRNPHHNCSVAEVASTYCQECEQAVGPFDGYQYLYEIEGVRTRWMGHKRCVLPMTKPCSTYKARIYNGVEQMTCGVCGWPPEEHNA